LGENLGYLAIVGVWFFLYNHRPYLKRRHKMKVAIFVDQFPVRSQTFVLNQITGLIDLGHEVQIIALQKGNVVLLESKSLKAYHLEQRCIYLLEHQSTGVAKLLYRLSVIFSGLLNTSTFLRVGSGLNPALGRQARNLMLAAIAAKQPSLLTFDWIVCHFGPNAVIANKLRKMGVVKGKIATFFHGVDISAQERVASNLADYQDLFTDTELCLPISQLWQDKLLSYGCPPNKTVVQRMGVDLRHFSYHIKAPAEQTISGMTRTLTIFSVARFTEKKGLRYAIQSLLHLPDTISINFQIAGYGDLYIELRNQVNRLNLADKVTFLGALDAEQVKAHMADADVFLQPSITAPNGDMEGVPVAIMEAMAVGTPVIATIHSGIPELIIDEQHGLLVPEKDSQAIAAKLSWLYYNPALGQLIAKQARIRIETIGDVNTLNRQLVSLFTERS
jgi:colanic acid/amylovoran biosynthesis glycosyltransferase